MDTQPGAGSEMIDPMKTPGYSIDAYMGELVRRGRSQATIRTYRRVLNQLAEQLPATITVDEITAAECRRFLDGWQQASKSTNALYVSVLRGYFEFLKDESLTELNPMERIRRPRRQKSEDLDVVTVSTDDVKLLLSTSHKMGWQEKICLSLLCYMGPRRSAAASLRWRDVDMSRGTITFHEKGDKVITKPIPASFMSMLEDARAEGLWDSGQSWLIPNYPKGPTATGKTRSSRIVYDIVKKVADRAGVEVHPHSLRAAFAVYFLETHDGDLEALKNLMGHARYETTGIYLRRLNRMRSMDRVRDLDWGVSFTSEPSVEAKLLQPVLQKGPGSKRNSHSLQGGNRAVRYRRALIAAGAVG